jgi:carbon starvation protein CstA
MSADGSTGSTGLPIPLPQIDITGNWSGHVNARLIRFKFEKTTLCGWVGQYQFGTHILPSNWTNITKIEYVSDYLRIEAPFGVCDGFITQNLLIGCYGCEKGASTWSIYR